MTRRTTALSRCDVSLLTNHAPKEGTSWRLGLQTSIYLIPLNTQARNPQSLLRHLVTPILSLSKTTGQTMTWTYSQSTGELKHDGVHVATGYSGIGAGRNNPAMQSAANLGPIPQGTYTIGAPRASLARGRWTMPLSPNQGTNTFGRSSLLIHADSIHHPGQASTGCIILPPPIRHDIASSPDRTLQVSP
jgi:hypothetical protein